MMFFFVVACCCRTLSPRESGEIMTGEYLNNFHDIYDVYGKKETLKAI